MVFGEGLRYETLLVRDFSAMRNYLQDPASTYGRREVYRVYRAVALAADTEVIAAAGLEYDVTVIPPGKIGREFVKTLGHYHPLKEGTRVRFPEVYEVISGKAFFLLQSASEDLERLERVYLLEAERGDKILIPPGYGHVSINPGTEVLVLANWQKRGMSGLYEPYEAHNGAAYYVLESERLQASGQTSRELEFTPNLSYNYLPELLRGKPRELSQYDLRLALPTYFTATKNLQSLDFLVNPENHLDELSPEKLFALKVYEKPRY